MLSPTIFFFTVAIPAVIWYGTENVPSISTLIGCCQGLITVDKEAFTVRLIHFTLQEYLSAHPDIFSRPHSAIAEICLTYLRAVLAGQDLD